MLLSSAGFVVATGDSLTIKISTGCHHVNAPCLVFIKNVLGPSCCPIFPNRKSLFTVVLLNTFCGSYTSNPVNFLELTTKGSDLLCCSRKVRLLSESPFHVI